MKARTLIFAAFALIITLTLAVSPTARALVENQVIGVFGVTPVAQQFGTGSTGILGALQNYGLIGTTGTTAATVPRFVLSGTAYVTPYPGTIAISGTSLYIGTSGTTWKAF